MSKSFVKTDRRVSGYDDVDSPSKDAELAALQEQLKQLEAKLEIHGAVGANSVGALGGQIEELAKKLQLAEAELRKSKEHNEELKSQLVTLQCRYDALVLEMESLRSKLQDTSAAQSCGMLWGVYTIQQTSSKLPASKYTC